MPGNVELSPAMPPPHIPAPANPPLPSATSKSRMVNYAAMSRLEGHGMPCAAVDVFFTSTVPDDSPTIKRYREPRILAPVRRTPKPSPMAPRRRKSSAVYHTPTASPRAYKVKGPQGVERALEDLMQSLKVAAASPGPAPSTAVQLVSKWSDSESGRERDASGFTWFSRKSDKSRSHTPSSSLDSTRQAQTMGRSDSMSFKRFAASLKSKSSLTSIRSIKSGRPRRTATPAPGAIGSGDEFSYLPSANSSTWSFATPATPLTFSTPNLSATAVPIPDRSTLGPKGPGGPGARPKSQKFQGFVKRLTAKRSRGPIPESFMPRLPTNGYHISHPGQTVAGTTAVDNMASSPSSTLSTHKSFGSKLQGTKRLASRPATRGGASGSGLMAHNGPRQGGGSATGALDASTPHRLEAHGAADASTPSTTTPPLPMNATMTSASASLPTGTNFRSATGRARVPGGQLGRAKRQQPTPGATNATPPLPASTVSGRMNKGTTGTITRGRPKAEVMIPASCDIVGDTRGMGASSAVSFMSRSPAQSASSPTFSTPITPIAKRKSSLPPNSTVTNTPTVIAAGDSDVRKRRSILTLIASPPQSPSFPTFHLHSPLRRRIQVPSALVLQPQPSNEQASMPADSLLHISPVRSPRLSPLMPCNRPLSKAESILGVRLRRAGSGFSLDRERAVSPMTARGDRSCETTEAEDSDDEVLSFSTPRHGRRATAMTFQSIVSPAASPIMAPARPASPSRWLMTSSSHPNTGASAHAANVQSLATPDLSFESLSELSDLVAERHIPSTPPQSPPRGAVSGRAVRAAVLAAAADPATKPRRLLHNLTGQRRASRKASSHFTSSSRSESAPASVPPVPPLPTEFGMQPTPSVLNPSSSPELSQPIASAEMLYATYPSPAISPLYASPSAAPSNRSINDVISRNFAASQAAASSSMPTPLAPRPRPPSVQLARGFAAPIPIAPDARLPPHKGHNTRKPQWPQWPPQWDPEPIDDDEFDPSCEVTPAALLPSNASVHTFGTSAASYRSRASNASSVFDFSKPRDEVMDVDHEEDSEEEWERDRVGSVRA